MSKATPERYIWKSGRPVYDLFAGLFGESATLEAEFEKVFLKSGVGELLEQRAVLEQQMSGLGEKIKGWTIERENLCDRLSEIENKFLEALINGDPSSVNDEKIRLSLELKSTDEWIATAQKIIFENQRSLQKLSKTIERAYHGPVMVIRDQAQAKIDELVQKIVGVEAEYQKAVRQVISEIKPSFPESTAWVELRARLPASLRCGV
jgi:hypothetical protein